MPSELPPDNPYTFKSFKLFPSMSEETDCFSASLWREGKKVAEVGNRGHGGSCEVRWLVLGAEAVFDAYVKTLPPCEYVHGDEKTLLAYDEDFFLLTMASEAIRAQDRERNRRRFAKSCLTNTLFRLKGDRKGEWRVINSTDLSGVRAFLTKKHGDSLEAILNDLLAGDPYAWERF
jgi:hypothetical protein